MKKQTIELASFSKDDERESKYVLEHINKLHDYKAYLQNENERIKLKITMPKDKYEHYRDILYWRIGYFQGMFK